MRGRPEGGAGDAAPRPSGSAQGHRAVGAVAVTGATRRSLRGPSRVVPACQPRVTGYGGRCVRFVIAWTRRPTPTAVGRRWSRCLSEGPSLKGQPTGGHAEQAYKHRARDAGETADLRWQLA